MLDYAVIICVHEFCAKIATLGLLLMLHVIKGFKTYIIEIDMLLLIDFVLTIFGTSILL